ncbi:hypothetical protein HHI36_006739 [Cryptolaemus montrouzieri]|uniref:Luciferin 4-monooxygenase n=1 Tax=Cryptolaemus montrouzieri TaxID=559131 RepID=A0ABD2NZ07_9CUCU
MDENFVLHGPSSPYEPAKGGIGVEIFRAMQLYKDKIAEFCIETGESSTYGDFLVRSRRVAMHLLSKKLKKEDTICLCSENQMNIVLPCLAAKLIDVCYATIEPTMPEGDLIYLFEYLKPKVLFVSKTAVDKIEKCLKEANIKCDVIVFGESQKYTSLSDILIPTPGEEEFNPVWIEDLMETAVIFLSSGTTGKPKGICCNHYSILSQAINNALILFRKGIINLSNFSYNIDETENESSEVNVLLYAPFQWITGIISLVSATFMGSTRTIGACFDVEKVWVAIKKYKPTCMYFAPGQIVDLYLKRDPNETYDFVDIFITGGGPVKSMHLEYMNEMLPKAVSVQVLGMTENTGVLSCFRAKDPRTVELQKKYPTSCGELAYGISCRIVDVDTESPCSYNQQGELRIKSKYLMNGYYKMDSTSCFDADGWFKTGDLAFFNEEGCLTVVDRLKDILLYRLYNIRPSVIEEILVKHPAVHQSFIIGIPHPQDNELPMGVVLLKEEYKNKVTPEEIVEYVNEKVPDDRYKIRAGIKFVDEILRTPSGKIKKIEMKKLIIDGKL